jgi:pSer/pThr/pTyr-binding forkhead associated (FHA) protein
MYKLVISDDEGKTTVVPLIRDEVTIGRKEGNTIRLTDRNVSRFHAKVAREGELFRIEDMGSLCGTKVNSKILKSESAKISAGDKISIGDYSLSIRTDVSSDVPLGRQMEPGDEAGIGKVTPHARIVVLTDPTPGREIDLVADLYVIGRSEEANLRVKDSSISRAHARIDLDAGEWTISDLDSINGILINGQKKDDYVLKAGDVIELGSVQLRYVAPGEPYEFDPSAQRRGPKAVELPVRLKSRTMLYALICVAVAAMVIIITAVALFTQSEETGAVEDRSSDKRPETYESLLEKGKDEIQSEEWIEAARLFALALQKKPDSQTAKELKQLSIMESDAQKSFNQGLEAEERQDWEGAVSLLGEIPRPSHYYDVEHLRKVCGKFCNELLEKAKEQTSLGNLSQAHTLLDRIDGIPEIPPNCADQKNKLQAELARLQLPDAGSSNRMEDISASKQSSKDRTEKIDLRNDARKEGKKSDFVPPINPYDSPSKSGRSSEAQDPVGAAHAAIRQGDIERAISILEKGGNSKSVLALLCNLYMKVGNRPAFETAAKKFILLYPNDPRAEKFKSSLSP